MKLSCIVYFDRGSVFYCTTDAPDQRLDHVLVKWGLATQARVGQNKAQKTDLREKWLRRLIVNFGDDEGSEGSFNGTVVQALLMMNGEDINRAITDREFGTVAVILKRRGVTPRSAMHEVRASRSRPSARTSRSPRSWPRRCS